MSIAYHYKTACGNRVEGLSSGSIKQITSPCGKRISLSRRRLHVRLCAERRELELWTQMNAACSLTLAEILSLDENASVQDSIGEQFPQIPRPDWRSIVEKCGSREEASGGIVYIAEVYYACSDTGGRILGEAAAEKNCFESLLSLPESFWKNDAPTKYLPAPLKPATTQVFGKYFLKAMPKPTIYYVHGFASGKNSSTGRALAEAFPQVSLLEYDSSGTFSENLKKLKSQLSAFDTSRIFVGSSLGAYYAAQLCAATGFDKSARLVLINPVLNPAENLKLFIGTNRSFETRESFELSAESVASYPRLRPPVVLTTLLSAENDELLDAAEARRLFSKNRARIVPVKGGHCLEDKLALLDAVQEISGPEALAYLDRLSLSHNEREVLIYRFGLKDGHWRSRREVGKIFSETPECIGKLEKEALAKICGTTLYDYLYPRIAY